MRQTAPAVYGLQPYLCVGLFKHLRHIAVATQHLISMMALIQSHYNLIQKYKIKLMVQCIMGELHCHECCAWIPGSFLGTIVGFFFKVGGLRGAMIHTEGPTSSLANDIF